uniref:Uncharacterized protein n=1 Tax=Panagrolaimus sp. ES5 TaxID=591445 RepID=A0AC34FFL1_9BILA
MEGGKHPYSYACATPSTSKKRKLVQLENVEEEENELKDLKVEMSKMKQLIKEQQKTIYNQAMTINSLQKNDNGICDTSNDDSILQESSNMTKIENEKKKFATEIAEMKSTMDAEAKKDNKIKELEELLSSIKNMKPDPECFNEEIQKLKEELQTTSQNYGNKIKDLKTQLDSKKYSEDVHKKRIFDLEEDNKQLTNIVRHASNGNTLKAMINERNKKIKELEDLLEMKEEDLRDLGSRITNLEATYKDIAKKTIAEKDEKYNKLFTENEKKMKFMIAEIQRQFENERKKYKEEIDELKDTVADVNKKFSDERKIAFQYTNDVRVLKAENNKLKVTVADVSKKLSEEQKLVIWYINETRGMKAKIDKQKITVTDLTKKLSDEIKSVIQYKSGIQKYKEEIDKLKITVDGLTAKVSEKKQNIIFHLSEIGKLLQKITVFEKNVARLKSRIEELEQKELENDMIVDKKINNLEAKHTVTFYD